MSARELHELPEWELDVLLGERASIHEEREREQRRAELHEKAQRAGGGGVVGG